MTQRETSSPTADPRYREVCASYPDDCQPRSVEFLGSAGGFSGAQLWRLDTPRGMACLRRWPTEHPSPERLEFIQAVLWYVGQEGFDLVPVPLETCRRSGYVRCGEHLWELSPWMPGQADYHATPSPAKLREALATIARFHLAAATFPLPDFRSVASPGIAQRKERLQKLLAGGLAQLQRDIQPGDWPELVPRAERLLQLFVRAAPFVEQQLGRASLLRVALQPCLRDIWHDHVLFENNRVSGLIDFGSLRPENVAADVARLLGSLAGDDETAWQIGMAAYSAVRPLTEQECRLVSAFDRSTVLMSGIQWLEWIYQQGRHRDYRPAVQTRLDSILGRLAYLAQQLP